MGPNGKKFIKHESTLGHYGPNFQVTPLALQLVGCDRVRYRYDGKPIRQTKNLDLKNFIGKKVVKIKELLGRYPNKAIHR